jgi:tetratricopeptide (TPR) repeat protein
MRFLPVLAAFILTWLVCLTGFTPLAVAAPLAEASSERVALLAERCLSHLNQGHYAVAAADCSTALTLDAVAADLYLMRGLAGYRQGDFEAALADYDCFLQLRPRDYRGYYNRGLVKVAQQRSAEALADFDLAVAFAPEDPSLADIYDDRGLALLMTAAPTAAMADFSRAIDLDPQNSRAYFNRGCACHQLGHMGAALANFDRVLALDPTNSRTYLKRALVHHQAGHSEAAIADLQQAARYAKQQGTTNLHHYILTLLDSLQMPDSAVA